MSIEQMKFAYLKEKGCALTGVRKIPDMGPDDVLVKQLVCNICTTDYGQWLGLREHQGYPMAGGHEGSGIVEAVGSGVKDLKPGDHVLSHITHAGNARPAGGAMRASVPARITKT